jgi:L-fuconolactonase
MFSETASAERMMKIDAHQHFWSYDESDYGWIPKGTPLHRSWLPQDLAPLLAAAGIDGTIAVQARQSIAESRWLLSLADESPVIKGVVGWADLRAENVSEDLAALAQHPKFVGVRHVLQDEPDETFMLRSDFMRGIARLAEFGLAYDLLIYPRQLPAAIELVRRFPEQRFVLDHLAKPDVKTGNLEPWREQIRALASSGNLSCKVSGLVTEADHRHWKAADLRPYLDVVFEAFGEDRLMFGSDWPVCLLAAEYAEVHALIADYVSPLPASARDKIMGSNAARFYRLS